MISFFLKYKHFLILVSLFFLAEIIVNPFREFPLNDDWSYSKSVLIFQNEGKFEIGDFGAMTLFTHLIWGLLFTKVFGFSFIVLRFSTLVSSVIGLWFLYKLILLVTQNKRAAFLGGLILLFNPMYFNLSNTFMTDINFNTLLIIASYLAFLFFQTKRFWPLFAFFVVCLLLVLVRQFGIILPVSFTLACFFLKEKRWLFVIISVLGTIFVIKGLKAYEGYLTEVLTSGSTYKFSGNIDLLDPLFWDKIKNNALSRINTTLLQVLMYTSPVALLYLVALIKSSKTYISATLALVSTFIIYYLFRNEPFPFKNIFSNMCIGPETFYESTQTYIPHTYSEDFKRVMTPIKFIFSFFSFFALSLVLLKSFKRAGRPTIYSPEFVLLMGVLISYTLLLFIADSYFDRYTIPLITVGIIIFFYFSRNQTLKAGFAVIPLVLLFYVSVFGTKDYLVLNDKKWEAYNYLLSTKKISPDRINAGFEPGCWNDGYKTWWSEYTSLKGYDYLIQFQVEPNFKILKEYEFQRYFPYKKDRICIFLKDSL